MNGLLDTLLKNADLLLPDGSVRRDAEVGIRGGAIVSIADRGQSGGAADAIDCGGNLLTPGFYKRARAFADDSCCAATARICR